MEFSKETEESVACNTLNWYAIYTRSRHEKKVASSLKDKSVEVFLPLRRVVSNWKDRRKEVEIPLFTGYIFVRIPAEERITVLKTGGVVYFVGNGQLPDPVPEDQILSIQRLVQSGLRYDPYPYLKEGMRVTIKRGPLRGVEGILLEKRSRHIFILSVDLIQQSAALQVNVADTDIA